MIFTMQGCQLTINNEMWTERGSGNKERSGENINGRNMLHFGAKGNYENIRLTICYFRKPRSIPFVCLSFILTVSLCHALKGNRMVVIYAYKGCQYDIKNVTNISP